MIWLMMGLAQGAEPPPDVVIPIEGGQVRIGKTEGFCAVLFQGKFTDGPALATSGSRSVKPTMVSLDEGKKAVANTVGGFGELLLGGAPITITQGATEITFSTLGKKEELYALGCPSMRPKKVGDNSVSFRSSNGLIMLQKSHGICSFAYKATAKLDEGIMTLRSERGSATVPASKTGTIVNGRVTRELVAVLSSDQIITVTNDRGQSAEFDSTGAGPMLEAIGCEAK